MISKKVGVSPKNDNYARLADYIADAGNLSRQGDEKSLMHWCAGCLGDDDYQNGIAEAVDVQAMNTRTKQSKTYHLVISFRPEDEARLTPEVFRAIEERFAAALGYTEHQRHCGVHKNTANFHMHMAYNMIHPEKHTRHEPFRDYRTRDGLCRELEREYGLVVDNGRTKDKQRSLGEKAALIEAHTGQQSFDSYAQEHREAILRSLEAAASWRDLHTALAEYGMEINPHGNGLAIKDRHSSRAVHAIKASALDRSLSLKKLEARFGPYQSPQALERIQERARYAAVPLQRAPERGQLFAEYQAGIEIRKATLQKVKEREDAALAAIRAEWAAKRRELESKNIAKKNLRRLLQLARKHEAEALAKARLSFLEPRSAVRRETPFTSWNGFLQMKAEQGNETALAVLRSHKEIVELEREPLAGQAKNWSQHGVTALKAEYAEKELATLEADNISSKGKNRLLSILRMERLAEEEKLQAQQIEPPLIAGFSSRIDRKGTVIFSLPGGGSIRDSGKEILFSMGDKATEQATMLYAQAKWGKGIQLEGNRVSRLSPEVEREKRRDMAR